MDKIKLPNVVFSDEIFQASKNLFRDLVREEKPALSVNLDLEIFFKRITQISEDEHVITFFGYLTTTVLWCKVRQAQLQVAKIRLKNYQIFIEQMPKKLQFALLKQIDDYAYIYSYQVVSELNFNNEEDCKQHIKDERYRNL